KKTREKAEAAEPLPELPRASPTELQRQLAALEKRFLELEGGLDSQARQELWPQLAQLYTAVLSYSDAGLCWAHALWDETSHTAQHAWGWVRTENKGREGTPSGKDLDRILSGKDKESLADVRLLTSYTVAAAGQEPPPAELVKRLRPIQEFLQKQEPL